MLEKQISVIIATRNRADALKNVSLPSLLKQEYCDFEIIVWDASDNEDSHRICENLAPNFKTIGVNLRYFSALRIGLTSQRNDAVKEAKGDFIFFIDDDSEVSPDGIGILIKAFHDNPDIMGIALPLENFVTPIFASLYVKILRFFKKYILSVINYLREKFVAKHLNRRVLSSAKNMFDNPKDPSGDAEWLSGCDMAFRKEVFGNISFDERLQKFGGYALAEDVDFSHKVVLKFRKNLLVTAKGKVKHINTQGGRIADEAKVYAAAFFNRYILRENFGTGKFTNKFYFYRLFIEELLHNLLTLRFKNLRPIARGFMMGKRAIRDQKRQRL